MPEGKMDGVMNITKRIDDAAAAEIARRRDPRGQ